MIEYQRNTDGIGFFKVIGRTFKKKLGNERINCDYCNLALEDEDVLIVIPFLNSAYCPDCGEEILSDCKPIDIFEEEHQAKTEEWYRKQFE